MLRFGVIKACKFKNLEDERSCLPASSVGEFKLEVGGWVKLNIGRKWALKRGDRGECVGGPRFHDGNSDFKLCRQGGERGSDELNYSAGQVWR